MTRLNRRDFCKTLAAMPAALSAAASTLPNIVYILADDLGWGDLGCYNQETAVPTPHANRFATQGMRFTDMHSPLRRVHADALRNHDRALLLAVPSQKGRAVGLFAEPDRGRADDYAFPAAEPR